MWLDRPIYQGRGPGSTVCMYSGTKEACRTINHVEVLGAAARGWARCDKYVGSRRCMRGERGAEDEETKAGRATSGVGDHGRSCTKS